MKKGLAVYYSWSNGNTERIAKTLAAAMCWDLAKIETAVPYRGKYEDVVQQGQEEVQHGTMPEIKPLGFDVAEYDVIAVGTPTWWYTWRPPSKPF